MENNSTIIAVAGKGGVGKTSISAAIVRLLAENNREKKILAIDADPAVGLSTALGITPEKTLEDIRKTIIKNVEGGETREAIELLGEARYRIFDIMVEDKGFAFIAIGRPEASGCYCKINSYLKEVISLLSQEFDYVVIDGEAGIEQINRRVMEKVTHLITVTDPSKKGTQVIQVIKGVADELMMYDKIGAIINRITDMSVTELVDTGDIPILSHICSDDNLALSDIRGNTIFSLPPGSPILTGVGKALDELKITVKGYTLAGV